MLENVMIGLGHEAQGMMCRMHLAGLTVAAWSGGTYFGSGMKTFATLPELMQAVATPRVVWLAPSVDAPLTLALLDSALAAGDVVVDCAPAHYRKTQERGRLFAQRQIMLVDAGIAGGDDQYGYALTLGGDVQAIERIKPGLEAIAPQRWLNCGPSGSGHFVRRMQSLMEGGAAQVWTNSLSALKRQEAIRVDLQAMAQLWQQGGPLYGSEQAFAVEFLNDSNVLQRIAANDPEDIAKLRQEMTPALNLALAVHYAGQGMSLFQRQIVAMMGGIPPRS